jgi:hypothetical protein
VNYSFCNAVTAAPPVSSHPQEREGGRKEVDVPSRRGNEQQAQREGPHSTEE